MEEASTGERDQERQSIVYYSHNPCHCVKEAIRGILKCLGLESSSTSSAEYSSSSSSEAKDDEVNAETRHRQSRSATQQGTTRSSSADSPSTTHQDNATLEDYETASVSRRGPRRPPISSESSPGGGSQIN